MGAHSRLSRLPRMRTRNCRRVGCRRCRRATARLTTRTPPWARRLGNTPVFRRTSRQLPRPRTGLLRLSQEPRLRRCPTDGRKRSRAARGRSTMSTKRLGRLFGSIQVLKKGVLQSPHRPSHQRRLIDHQFRQVKMLYLCHCLRVGSRRPPTAQGRSTTSTKPWARRCGNTLALLRRTPPHLPPPHLRHSGQQSRPAEMPDLDPCLRVGRRRFRAALGKSTMSTKP
mmetsp:Transcript_174519/g.559507  ORF Transcript_174519/g.559507 Transcript_174519/m.559507 type:complete len:226 (+) Transcript_174519:552-1229(+)